jgi:hypothetical protein
VQRKGVYCEYLSDNGLCNAVVKDEDGKKVREESCVNKSKNSCCYLCNNQDTCSISCNYLAKPENVNKFNEYIDHQISEYKGKIENLSLLFADGKIGEQSYVNSVKALEQKIDKLNQSKANPLTSPKYLNSFFEESESVAMEKPSAFWYLVPFFFAILGGVVAYVGTKDRDKGMANRLLIFGILWSVFEPILVYLIIIFLLSLR